MTSAENAPNAILHYTRLLRRAQCVLAALILAVGIWLVAWFVRSGVTNPVPAAIGAVILLALAALYVCTTRNRKFCRVCGCLVADPSWTSKLTYCPNCERLVDPSAVLFSQPGFMDLSAQNCLANTEPIAKLFSLVVLLAIKDKATRVVFEPQQDQLRLTYLVEGQKYELIPPPIHLRRALGGVVKAMAGLDFRKEDAVQQGEIEVKLAGPSVRLLITVEPTEFGERVTVKFPTFGEESSSSAAQILEAAIAQICNATTGANRATSE